MLISGFCTRKRENSQCSRHRSSNHPRKPLENFLFRFRCPDGGGVSGWLGRQSNSMLLRHRHHPHHYHHTVHCFPIPIVTQQNDRTTASTAIGKAGSWSSRFDSLLWRGWRSRQTQTKWDVQYRTREGNDCGSSFAHQQKSISGKKK